jgi:hypothetical protein
MTIASVIDLVADIIADLNDFNTGVTLNLGTTNTPRFNIAVVSDTDFPALLIQAREAAIAKIRVPARGAHGTGLNTTYTATYATRSELREYIQNYRANAAAYQARKDELATEVATFTDQLEATMREITHSLLRNVQATLQADTSMFANGNRTIQLYFRCNRTHERLNINPHTVRSFMGDITHRPVNMLLWTCSLRAYPGEGSIQYDGVNLVTLLNHFNLMPNDFDQHQWGTE